MNDDRYGSAPFTRAALLPGLLGAIVLLAGLALIGGSWFIGVRYAVSILAVILCVMTIQARSWWWLIGLVPIAIVWNPVWPLELDQLWWRVGAILAAAMLIAAGVGIKTPLPEEPGSSGRRGASGTGRQGRPRR